MALRIFQPHDSMYNFITGMNYYFFTYIIYIGIFQIIFSYLFKTKRIFN